MAESNDDFGRVINRIIRDIEDLEAKVTEKKRMANQLREYQNQPPLFPGIDTERIGNSLAINADQFHGRRLATAVREYLELRGPSDGRGLGAAVVNEIYSALVQGGYEFETNDEKNAKRSLRIALTKNSITFRRINSKPEVSYGLLDWYPSAKPPKAKDIQPENVDFDEWIPRDGDGEADSQDETTQTPRHRERLRPSEEDNESKAADDVESPPAVRIRERL